MRQYKRWLGFVATLMFFAGCATVAPERPSEPHSGIGTPSGSLAEVDPERAARVAEVVMSAMSLIGIPYRNGGESPQTGMDCSGFVRYVFRAAIGLDLPRRAVEIGQVGQTVRPAELQPGDLVFFNTLGRTYSHVGIYIGEGRFIHAPSQRGSVRVENMSLRYWSERFDGIRRLS